MSVVIPGYDNYLAYSDGRIYSLFTNRFLKPTEQSNGYLKVTLSNNKKQFTPTVHSLIAKAYIPKPDGKTQVNHIDGSKHNNDAANLEWVTAKENITHAVKTGLRNYKGVNNPNAKLSKLDMIEINTLLKKGDMSHADIGKIYNVSRQQIFRINKNRTL